jgi:cytochrome c553
MMRSAVPVAMILAVASSIGSTASAAGDAAAGKLMAQEQCASCHDTGPDGAFKQYPRASALPHAHWRGRDHELSPHFVSMEILPSPTSIWMPVVS